MELKKDIPQQEVDLFINKNLRGLAAIAILRLKGISYKLTVFNSKLRPDGEYKVPYITGRSGPYQGLSEIVLYTHK